MRIYFIFFLFLFALAACKGPKAIEGLSEEEQMEAIREAKADTKFQRKFFEAEKEKGLGDLDKALRLYYEAQEIKSFPNLNYQIARLEANNGNTETALKQATIAYEGDPTNAWYAELVGELHEYDGRFEQAAQFYEQAAENEQGENERLFKAVQMYVSAGQSNKAIDLLNDLEEETGISEEISLRKHGIYLSEGKSDKAIEALNQLIELDPENVDYKLYLVDTYFQVNQLDEAGGLLNELVKEYPENGGTQLRLMEIFLSEGKDAEAKEALIKGIEADDISFEEKIERVLGFVIDPNQNQADQTYTERLLSTLRSSHPMEGRGHALSGDYAVSMGNKVAAEEYYSRAVELDPNQNNYWKTLISLQLESGKYSEVSKNASSALDRYPTDPDFYFLKGLGELRAKNAKGAITWLETGLEYVVGNLELKSRFYSALGEAHNDAKQFAKSDAAFEESLKLIAGDRLVKNNYAYFLALRGAKLPRALELIEQVMAIEPNNVTYLDTYAWVLFKQGENQKALTTIEKAIANGAASSGEVQEHKGDILMALGEKAKALSAYQQALELGGASLQIEQKIKKSAE